MEAQRLGLPTFGSDLNPVPVLISRALTELLPKTYNQQPLHPEVVGDATVTSKRLKRAPVSRVDSLFGSDGPKRGYAGFEGIMRDVMYYAEQVRELTADALADSFPTQPGEKIVAWLWARTATCTNPTCGAETVLATSWWLSKKKGDLAWIEPRAENGVLHLDVVSGRKDGQPPQVPKLGRGASFKCLVCEGVIDEAAMTRQALGEGLGLRLTAVVSESDSGRRFRAPEPVDIEAARAVPPADVSDISLGPANQYVAPPRFGITEQSDLYTPRQLAVLATLSDMVSDTHSRVVADGGTREWADCIVTILGLGVGKRAQFGSMLSAWKIDSRGGTGKVERAFPRADLPMTWDFAEANPLGQNAGSWIQGISTLLAGVPYAATGAGTVVKQDARSVRLDVAGIVMTDPPYFDAIPYADLSDFFYLWHRRSLRNVHPDLYATMAAPKQGELTAFAGHHGGDKGVARDYFVDGFTDTFNSLQTSLAAGLPLCVVYASKEQKGGTEEETRWSSILTAMVRSNLEITGTWPIHGTGSTRMRGLESNAVATYIVMSARPRPKDAGSCSLADFNRSLRRELKPAVHDLQAAGILPVDLAQAAMGPGMQIYSRYRAVVDQTGKPVPVEQALRLINAALGEVLDEQEGELDPDSRFAVAWWEKHGWEPAPFGEADQLARPQGISVDDVIRAGVATYPKAGFVSLVGIKDMNRDWFPSNDTRPTAWEAVHHLADRLIEGGGVLEAGRLMGQLGLLRDPAQALVYRLHAIAARKGRQKDQERYNALIGSWSDCLAVAATEKDGLF